MKLEVKREDGTATARISGSVDEKTAPLIQTALSQLLQERNLILRLEELTHISNAGLRMLFMLQRQAQDNNRQITLVGLKEELLKAMADIGFLEFFQIQHVPEVNP